ncbi:MAG TPA: caspase family protein, partial [Gemmataceae bacterium]|nr:caspase family protein [Gemmataceae bacterium]
RFWILLPGETEPVAGLWLHKPESTLFEQWARADKLAPGGKGYRFLAVSWGGGQWTFSTDPEEGRRIDSLARLLQKNEEDRDVEHAKADPWYDGSRGHHWTIVGAPWTNSRLSDDEVLAVMRRWGQSRLIPRANPKRAAHIQQLLYAAVAVFVIVIALTAALPLRMLGGPRPETVSPPAVLSNPPTQQRRGIFQPVELTTNLAAKDKPKFKPVSRGHEELQKTPGEYRFTLTHDPKISLPRRIRFYFGFEPAGAYSVCPQVNVTLLGGNGTPMRDPIPLPVKHIANKPYPRTEERDCIIQPNEDYQFLLQYAREAADDKKFAVTFYWTAIDTDEWHLFVQTIGVAYPKESGQPRLMWTQKDAQDLDKAFRLQEGPLFIKVHSNGPCIMQTNTTKQGICDSLKQLREDLNALDEESGNDKKPQKIAIIYLSGHGFCAKNKAFVFYCSDYSTAHDTCVLKLSDLLDDFRGVNYPVIVILDCCYAGGACQDLDAQKNDSNQPGYYVLAACSADQRAQEIEKDHHSVLATALLNIILGQGAANRTGPITLQEAIRLAEQEVKSKTSGKQTIESGVKNAYYRTSNRSYKMNDLPFCVPTRSSDPGSITEVVGAASGR